MLVLLLSTLLLSLNCQGPLANLCNVVAPKVEALWWKSNATVYVTLDSSCFTEGPFGNSFVVHLCSKDPSILAHELTHVLQIERGLRGPLWLIEGMAELTSYLLYPSLHNPYYEERWLTKGYGYLNDTEGIYGGGLVILYSVYEELGKEGVLRLFDNINYKEIASIVAKHLATCDTPHNLCPSYLKKTVLLGPLSWAGSDRVDGNAIVIGKVAVAYGKAVARPMPINLSSTLLGIFSIPMALRRGEQFLKSFLGRAT